MPLQEHSVNQQVMLKSPHYPDMCTAAAAFIQAREILFFWRVFKTNTGIFVLF